jgi:hypothetical protein
LFFALEKAYMPFKLNSASMAAQVKQLLHEIAAYYGNACTLAIEATIAPKSENAIKIDHTKGIVVGGNDDVLVTLTFFASNATTNNSLAAEFQMNFAVAANVSWNDFIIHLHVAEVSIHNTKITKDNVGLYARNYDQLFTGLLNMVFSQLNTKYQNGFDLRSLDPNVQFVAGMFTNSTITPV